MAKLIKEIPQVYQQQLTRLANRLFQQRRVSEAGRDALIAGSVVGKDNKRNQSVVNITGSNQNIKTTEGDLEFATSTIVRRANARSGKRLFSASGGRKITSRSAVPLTQAYEDTQSNITGCTDNDPSNFNQDPPDEAPEEPTPAPAPPAPPGSPNDPEPLPEPTPVPDGCSPEDTDQWYNASGPGAQFCPAGTSYKGFSELPAGTFMVLCGGPSRPPGDGCPIPPTGFSCIGGVCTAVDGGTFATIEDCQSAGCEPLGYSCVNGECQQVPLSQATFATLAECEVNCEPEPDELPPDFSDTEYACIGGDCVPTTGGQFGSLQACVAGGCEVNPDPIPADFNGGQCPGRTYSINGTAWFQQTGFARGTNGIGSTFIGPVTQGMQQEESNVGGGVISRRTEGYVQGFKENGETIRNTWVILDIRVQPNGDETVFVQGGLETLDVSPFDGGADNCGDPEPYNLEVL